MATTELRRRTTRSIALVMAALVLWGSATPVGATSSALTTADLQAYLEHLWPDAERQGISRTTFDAAFAGVTPDPTVAAMTERQPEFAKPIGAYLAAQVTASRVTAGRAMAKLWSKDLATIEQRYQVPRSILVAVWGLETNYGTSAGGKDVIRSMVTLAALNFRPDLYHAELLAALAMLQRGEVARTALRGSWAGAMGQPQFMPSSFETYAVDWTKDGRRDIWSNVPDALASIANFIRQQGWRSDRPWGFEVRLPAGFDDRFSRADNTRFAALGVQRADGKPMPTRGDSILFFPSGAKGPAFLVTENFEVLKTYNFSDAYVLSVGQLADRIDGGAVIQAAWPNDAPISRAERIALQSRLVELGYTVDNREGRISLALRDVIRAAQASVGLVPDGEATSVLIEKLRTAPHP